MALSSLGTYPTVMAARYISFVHTFELLCVPKLNGWHFSLPRQWEWNSLSVNPSQLEGVCSILCVRMNKIFMIHSTSE